MVAFKPDWLPFALGSLPHTTVAAAWDVMLKYMSAIPSWPQLPQKAAWENMYTQVSERFPGMTFDNGRVRVDREANLNAGIERLYLAYLEDDLSFGAISPNYASALAVLRQGHVAFTRPVAALKGQITGPISWGLTVVDQSQRPILYDQVLADAVSKHLRLKAAWQERELARFAPQTIMFVDEPYLGSLGSAFVSVSRDQVIGLLEEVFNGLRGLKGVHCCGNTDWSILFGTSVDIVSLDAYDYAESLVVYGQDVNRFLERGGIIAWGIAPAGIAAETETVESLVQRLHDTIERLVAKGVSREAILRAGLVTPSCGLGSLSPALAEHVLKLTLGVSNEMRRRYVETSASQAKPAVA